MTRLEVRPFDLADVSDAGVLLAERHRQHRMAQPKLSARYEQIDAATAEVNAAFAAEDASGAVAMRAGQLVGYLVGAPKKSAVWGPNVWVEAAGQAVTEAEVIRELYATAATRWVDEGRTAQYTLVPAHDAHLANAWFRLGFGQQHAHAIRDVTTAPQAARVSVRRATQADVPTLAQLDLELPRHQGLAPTFSAGMLPSLEESLSEWAKDIDSSNFITFVAEHDGIVIGSAVGCALERSGSHTGPARPDNAGFLSFAAVFPQARGLGAGRALGQAVIAWAAETGHDSVVTDWRVTNLLSSRAWPALGFTETFLRLHRLIGY